MNKYIKSILLITFWAVISIPSFAQNSGIRDIDRNKKEDLEWPADIFRIGVTPSALLNTYIALQMNAAVNLSNNIQFNMEAGWITSGSAFNNAETKGHRIRPALRWYIKDRTEYRIHLSVAYNIRNTRSQRVSGFMLPDGTPLGIFSYEQERKVKGPAFLVGLDYWLSKRVVLDIGFGIGSGKLQIIDIDAPTEGIKGESFFVSDEPGISSFPIFIFNLRFQYVF